MATRIVSLQAKLGLDGTGFQQGLRKATSQMQEMGYSANTLQHHLAGAFSIYALERFVHHVVETASRFRNLAEQMNITTDEAQTFDAAAIHSGQTLEDLQGPLNKLAAARRDAAEGNEDLRATFARLGISQSELQDPLIRNIDLMRKIADRIQHINFTAREAAEFRDLFGKSGQRLAAIFRDLEDVHITPISEDDIDKIHRAHHALEMVKRQLVSIGAGAIGTILPEEGATTGQKLARAWALASNPGLFFGTQVGRKLNEFLFPASAQNPKPRSAELVGPPMAEGPLFQEKAKKQRAIVDSFVYPHRVERTAENFLSGLQTRRGSVSAERGFALLGGKEQSRIELNTKQTVEELRKILPVLRMISQADDLKF